MGLVVARVLVGGLGVLMILGGLAVAATRRTGREPRVSRCSCSSRAR